MQNSVSKASLAGLLMAGTMLATPALAADIEGNIGVTTDYIWRGMTQNDGGTSASGGLDVSFDSGMYIGTWVGDTAGTDYGTQEVDYYIGYAGESGSISYDVGYLTYTYPSSQATADVDFSEVYFTVGTGPVSLSYYYLADAEGADAGDSEYISLDYETSLSDDWGLALHYGDYTGDFSSEASDISITVSKGDFALSLVTTDGLTGVDDDMRFVASWGIGF